MDLQERQKARSELNNTTAVNSPAKVSKKQLQRVEDAGAPTLQEIETKIHNAVIEWNNENGVRDWSKETQRRFSALCSYIGRQVFMDKRLMMCSPLLRAVEGNPVPNNNRYDIQQLDTYYSIFYELAVTCDKCPTRWAFLSFCNLHYNFFENWKQRENLTQEQSDFYKKVCTNEEKSNYDGLLGGRQNVVGLIFAGKNLYGWKDAKEVHQVTETRRNLDEIAQSMGVGLPVDNTGGME